MNPQVVRYSERPELWKGIGDLSAEVWPEYNLHGHTLNYYWGQLYDVFPEWQFVLYDPQDDGPGRGPHHPGRLGRYRSRAGTGHRRHHRGRLRLRAAGGQPTAVCALAAEIPPRHQGRRLSGVLLQAMAGLGRDAGLDHLIAPVRPSRKDRYPTIPIERYARWTRPDGSPFDPWIRVHTQLGARIGPVIPRSLHITGTVEEWESWTQMRFPESGDYVFPAGLATSTSTANAPRPVLGTQHLDHPPAHPRHSPPPRHLTITQHQRIQLG